MHYYSLFQVFKLTQTAAAHCTTGHIINLVSNDVRKCDNFFRSFHHLWLAPLELALTTYLVWRLIGWLAVAASFYMMLFIPILGILGNIIKLIKLNPMVTRFNAICFYFSRSVSCKRIKLAWVNIERNEGLGASFQPHAYQKY